MKKIRKKLVVAVTVAFLAFPLSTALTLADTTAQSASTTTTNTPTDPTSTTTPTDSTTTTNTTTTTPTDTTTTTPTDTTTTTNPTATTTPSDSTTTNSTTTPVVDANGNTVAPENWFTDLIGKLQLFLTFDPARKCELNERHALAKLAQAQKLIQAGQTDAAQSCLNEYSDKITQAQSFLEQVKDPTSQTAVTLTKALANVDSNNIQVLSSLLDKLPPQAAQRLAVNVVRSMEKAVTRIQKEEGGTATNSTPTPAPIPTPTPTPAPASTSTSTPTSTPAPAPAPTSAPILTSTASSATSSATPVTDSKSLEKQAKMALKEFQKALNQKGKFHLEDQDQQSDEDNQTIPQSQPIHETVASINPQTESDDQISEHNKEDRNNQQMHGNDKRGGKHDNHRGE